jgi:hypothetical protein
MTVFRVYRNGKFFDEVFYQHRMTIAEVRKDLIEHDGYPTDISVWEVRLPVTDQGDLKWQT